ncbi:glycoside hydrolase family 16 protein [Nocardioides sp. ChNu-153]|uniref:glycoside hydrolase family 16 protein n=1 Tax=unclassified Nocardioides TaxID=2615069 RepID=UPI002406C84C|nr:MULTISPECIES: glycoside hydrolase family 16 protein [unclassified Nocardioides]MDF9714760.1 glycoside hydrolase family 16 protein [Nocardioides sp. ChNu-99]MDN7120114.1 glycoside hydrolase family 16 protein [Nocardioides sp. ChNu-153]
MTRARIDETFTAPALDPDLWVPHYLPHWTIPKRSAARYDLDEHGLRLRVDADQPAWREADGQMRVSNVQTATWAGPVGGTAGTHRHRPDGLVVVTGTPTWKGWVADAGEVVVRASASPDPTCMLGIWLVGVDDSGPDDSGELCIAELFGDRIGPGGSTVRVGVKAHHDPRLVDEVTDVDLPIDATQPHEYGVRWGGERVEFTVDGAVVATSAQRIDYEQQLMIDLFEFPADERRDPAAYPKTAHVHAVRAVSR